KQITINLKISNSITNLKTFFHNIKYLSFQSIGDISLATDSLSLNHHFLFSYHKEVISRQLSRSFKKSSSSFFVISSSNIKAFVSKFTAKLLTSILAVPTLETMPSIDINFECIKPFSY